MADFAAPPSPETAWAGVTHVVVGYSAGLLDDLDRMLPPRSVLVVEEGHAIDARRARARLADIACVAGILAAPTQDEAHPERVVAVVPRLPDVRAVVPAVEYGVVAAAALADAWSLPGAGVEAAKMLRDKALLRVAAGAAGISQPDWAHARGPADVRRLRDRNGGGCVLKPANRQASLGVQLLGPDDDVHEAWLHTVAADEPKLRTHYDGAARYLVEQRLHGPEVSVEVLVHNGEIGFLNVTAKSVQATRHPVETGHVVPAGSALIDPMGADTMRAAMASLIAATGFGSGVLHAEWILVDGRPHLVECAGRLPGDSIDRLIDLAYGGSILEALLAVLAGDAAAPARAATGAAAIRFLPAGIGRITSIDGVVNARHSSGVRDVRITVAVGDTVGLVTNSWQRAGYVIAVGADAEAAARNADRALELVRISTETPVAVDLPA